MFHQVHVQSLIITLREHPLQGFTSQGGVRMDDSLHISCWFSLHQRHGDWIVFGGSHQNIPSRGLSQPLRPRLPHLAAAAVLHGQVGLVLRLKLGWTCRLILRLLHTSASQIKWRHCSFVFLGSFLLAGMFQCSDYWSPFRCGIILYVGLIIWILKWCGFWPS